MKNKICYCFNFSEKDIEEDFNKNGKSTILEKIIFEKKMGGCSCHENHPKAK